MRVSLLCVFHQLALPMALVIRQWCIAGPFILVHLKINVTAGEMLAVLGLSRN